VLGVATGVVAEELGGRRWAPRSLPGDEKIKKEEGLKRAGV